MNLFKEMEVNYKDFIESANDFMNSCRKYTKNNEDEKIFLQFGEITEKKRWQDKIKAKIEEYKELSNNVTMQPQIYSYIVDVLQSLLEKEQIYE